MGEAQSQDGQVTPDSVAAVYRWLFVWRWRQLAMLFVGAVLCVVVGFLLMMLTRWGVMLISFRALGYWVDDGHWIHFFIGNAFVFLLFLGCFALDPDYLSKLSVASSTNEPFRRYTYVPFLGEVYRDPEQYSNQLKFAVEILGIGPKILMHTLQVGRTAWLIGKINVPPCAQVLAILAAAEGKVTFEEILQQLDSEAGDVFLHLRHVKGVLFLEADPPGLTLLPEWREKLQSL